jgi:hypothetical protein
MYLLGNEYQHLHDSYAKYCLNIGTVDAFLIMKKEADTNYTLYASHGGEEKPLITAKTQDICKSIIRNIMNEHVAIPPHTITDINDLVPRQDIRSGEEILTDMFQTLIDTGYEDLVDEFTASQKQPISLNNVNKNISSGENHGLQAEETQTEEITISKAPAEERLESPQEV